MSKLNSERLNSFGTASIPKLVLQFSVPSIVSMLVNALYNIVDRLFVGQEVGSLGIAGITLCFPIMLFIMAMSMMIGVGGNTLFAIRLGQKKYIQASIILNNSFSLLLLMAATTFTLGEIFMEPLLRLFGASDQTLPVASSYMRILLCGAVFQTVAPGMNHFIRSMGHPKTAMFREVIGAVTNIAFDWLFIVQFHWGIEGAAWATIGSQLVAASLITQFFVKKDTPIRIRWRHMKLRFAYVRKIIILGIPPSIMQVCNSLLQLGGQEHVRIRHREQHRLVHIAPVARLCARNAADYRVQLRRAPQRPREGHPQVHVHLRGELYARGVGDTDVEDRSVRGPLRTHRPQAAGSRRVGHAYFRGGILHDSARARFGQLFPGYRKGAPVHVPERLQASDSANSLFARAPALL